MDDQVLRLKKELDKIADFKDRSVMEKYQLIRTRYEELGKDERYILKKKYEEECEVNQGLVDITCIPSLTLSICAICVAMVDICFKDREVCFPVVGFIILVVIFLVLIIVCAFVLETRKKTTLRARFVLNVLNRKKG